MSEKLLWVVADKTAADAIESSREVADALAARQAYELANMSPYIKPEHYAQCITQRVVVRKSDTEIEAPPNWIAVAKPKEADLVRLTYTIDNAGTVTEQSRLVVEAKDDGVVAVVDEPSGGVKP